MWGIVIAIPIYFIVINGVQSVQHTNGMVGSCTYWELS